MKHNKRQTQLINELVRMGVTSPVSRQELAEAVENSQAYASPPSWITQDANRKAGRGLYYIPEIDGVTPVQVEVEPVEPVEPVAVEPVAVEPVAVELIKGMTGGDRATLVPQKFKGFVKWGHYADVKTFVKSGNFVTLFVTGLSGNGKTLMVEEVCADLGRECFRVNLTCQTDEDDLLGGFRLINGETVWQDGPVVTAMKVGAVLLLDEVDLASNRIMCLQSVLEGKGVFLKKIGQWVTPSDGFAVIATANTKGKGDDTGNFVGTGVMNEAFLERFDYCFEQPYATPATEKKILMGSGCGDDDFADKLTRWADMIRKTFYQDGCDSIISTRRLVKIVKAYNVFNDKSKALQLSLSRFDDKTKEGFIKLYEKIDAELIDADGNDVVDATETASATGNECPF